MVFAGALECDIETCQRIHVLMNRPYLFCSHLEIECNEMAFGISRTASTGNKYGTIGKIQFDIYFETHFNDFRRISFLRNLRLHEDK